MSAAGSASGPARGSSLAVQWSSSYDTAWDDHPEEYVARGLVAWGRSRRLARVEDRTLAFKAYIGVQHFDPARWHAPGDARSTFFLSLFIANRTVALRTYPTLGAALAALYDFHDALRPA